MVRERAQKSKREKMQYIDANSNLPARLLRKFDCLFSKKYRPDDYLHVLGATKLMQHNKPVL
eukprot:COSAG01_NODE_799_length_13501_cov_15.980749_12_plen_62_part_00